MRKRPERKSPERKRRGPALPPRTVQESVVEMREIVLPNDANIHGTLLGGRLMHLMDLAAAMVVHRHGRRPAVTAQVDEITFLHPVHVGEHLILRGTLNRAFGSSMEVGVIAFAENPWTGECRQTSSAFFTFVAVDEEGRPVPVQALVPQTAEEKRRWREAGDRRRRRLGRRARP